MDEGQRQEIIVFNGSWGSVLTFSKTACRAGALSKHACDVFVAKDCKVREHFGNQVKRSAFQQRCETCKASLLKSYYPCQRRNKFLLVPIFFYSAKDILGVSLLHRAVAGFKKVCNSLYFFENQRFFVFCI